MSYGFTVKNAGGTLTLDGVYGSPSDDLVLTVNGHADSVLTSVGVNLMDAEGKQIVGASASARTPAENA
jgi:hypothetical protein